MWDHRDYGRTRLRHYRESNILPPTYANRASQVYSMPMTLPSIDPIHCRTEYIVRVLTIYTVNLGFSRCKLRTIFNSYNSDRGSIRLVSIVALLMVRFSVVVTGAPHFSSLATPCVFSSSWIATISSTSR